MNETDLDLAADIAVGNPYRNPREIGPAQRAGIRHLLQNAYDGGRAWLSIHHPAAGP